MDISFCDDDGETPSLADCCTQVSSTTFSDASTHAYPTMKDANIFKTAIFIATHLKKNYWLMFIFFIVDYVCMWGGGINTYGIVGGDIIHKYIRFP